MFRCPGGKRRVAETIVDQILEQCGGSLENYCEPFAATAAVGLRLLKTVSVERVWLNDIDRGTFSLWWCVLHDQEREEFLRLVDRFKPSKRAFVQFKKDLLSGADFPLTEIALMKIACHQMSFSGLGAMAGGAMTAVSSRWSPRWIRKNVDEARRLFAGSDVRITNLDYKDVLREVDASTFVFLDPPFYQMGTVLYQHSFTETDHADLAAILRSSRFNWLLSYDDCPEIRRMYDRYSIREIQMKYTIHTVRRKNELLIAPPTAVSATAIVGIRPDMFMGPGEMLSWSRPENAVSLPEAFELHPRVGTW